MAYISIFAKALRYGDPALEFTMVRTNVTFIHTDLELGKLKEGAKNVVWPIVTISAQECNLIRECNLKYG